MRIGAGIICVERLRDSLSRPVEEVLQARQMGLKSRLTHARGVVELFENA
jgi:hypothetical protein